MFDILIKNGYVVDGSGRPRFKADVGVKSGRIAGIGELVGSADRVIDATGLFVSPGFIDCHAHSDWSILIHPTGDSKILQGCTTDLSGQCGFSSAPIDEKNWWKLVYVRLGFGWSMHYTAAAYNWKPLPYGRQVEVDWSTLREYLGKVEENGIGINFALLTGHSNLRYYAMGLENRQSTQGELDEMKAMLEQALKEGSFGMSAGLSASPGCWASTDELIKLAKVVKKYDGVYMVHQRGEIMGEIERGALPRIKESIEIAEKSGVRACISHVLLDPETRRPLDEARARGVDITCDMFPYPGSIAGNLVYMLPHWLARHRENGLEFIVDRLKDPAVRRRLVEKEIPEWFRTAASIPGRYEAPRSPAKMAWDRMQLQKVWTARNRKYVGLTFDQIAKDMGTDPWNALMDIIVEEEGYARWLSLYWNSLEDMYWPAFAETLRAPYGCIESDAPIESPRGVTVTSADPRSYGIFPLVLGEYVRKRSVVTWEAAIKKMTSDSARAIGISDRGLLSEGFWADVVIFNPRTIAHKANFKNCLEVSQGINHDLYPTGIEYVIVNGVIAAEKGRLTGLASGQVLRHGVPSA